ncbi:4-hydroxyphenylacetate 3-hydroxylase [Amycolatopsis acidiphila]|uniref:4-hydroxyphenylacetate 3-hydroxylase n=1 Tax=Amycolatopsis acidiphila TaxID=715473 RepID=A0A558ALW0_9PSEU|nr:4-hydroxyphenylacetate 3-hydroxylase N-terminal domain-containing protein [Amycolatopsis acidiphila]TVT25248.1 4-hydroxyphenylacetate 3-hydroxylase [Amycolatopsis acidiphila]UIJ62364.1 4-hydroxyphenylacetate 3-hydroxylase [Amycolatopsis acidiphila]GHG83266.1 pyoverdin chromophore biosynthetic protein pvcC [Amycolatopsis acidiphila]
MTRSGKEYVEGLRDERRVFIDGEYVSDVANHPAFKGAVESIARVYDMANDPENAVVLTYPSPTTGAPVNLSYLIPRDEDDLRRRRVALRRTAEMTLGLMGRGPEHVAGFLAGWAGRPDVFAAGGRRFADNVTRFYEHVRDNDLYCSYAIIPPQIDRSKPAHQQADPHLYAGVKEEREDGIVIAGAQMLGTGAAISDYLILSCIVPLQPGDEDQAISVAVPLGARGLKIYSRRGYAEAAPSVFDYPLTSRFDETDSLIVFDDVFVPWERVFVFRDRQITSDQWNRTPAHLLGNNQAQIRFSVKLDLLAGLAMRVAQMNGSDKFPPVRGTLGELAAHASMVLGLVYAQEQNCEIDEHGVAWPGRAECFAAMTLQSDFYPKLLHLVRDLCGGGVIQLPSSAADFGNAEARADFERYVQSPGYPSAERVKLLKLVWDMVGSEFASRHQQYEMFYAGAPFLVRSRMSQVYDFDRAGKLVDRALAGYGLE